MDRHYIIDKVLKTRPNPHGPSLRVIGQAVRSKTMALFGAHPDLNAAHPEKLDGVTTEMETVRASESDRNSHQPKSDAVQSHGEIGSNEGNRANVPKPTLAAVPSQNLVGLPEDDHGAEAVEPQATTVASRNQGIMVLAGSRYIANYSGYRGGLTKCPNFIPESFAWQCVLDLGPTISLVQL